MSSLPPPPPSPSPSLPLPLSLNDIIFFIFIALKQQVNLRQSQMSLCALDAAGENWQKRAEATTTTMLAVNLFQPSCRRRKEKVSKINTLDEEGKKEEKKQKN